MNTQNSSNKNDVAASAPAYQAPTVESVVTFDNLQREVFYAGNNVPISNPGGGTTPAPVPL